MISREEIRKSFDGRFPEEYYDILQSSSAAIAGLGGLGSHIAVMLARSGVGHLHLVDYDRVDISNLNRQEYDVCHIGQLKTEALPERLLRINPYLEITTENVMVTEENAVSIFGGYRYICEAFDKPQAKAMLINTLMTGCPDSYIVSGNGMAGFHDANLIRTRQLGSRLFICGDGSSDVAEGMGLMAARVSVCAGHQANKIIELMINDNTKGTCDK